MHEYQLVNSLLESISEKVRNLNNLRKINSVRIKVGILNMVTPQALKEIFKETASSAIFKDAELIIEEIPGSEVIVEDIEAEFAD